MSQFGLSSSNSHWGYGAAGAYSPYLTPSSLGSCAAPSTPQFNAPALGFSGSAPDQTTGQDAFSSSAVTTLLPDSTGTDLEQHLGLVPSNTHTPNNHQVPTNHTSSSLLVPRYTGNGTNTTSSSEYTLSGPRSISDNSSAAESPVQDDLLTNVNNIHNSTFMTPTNHQNTGSSTGGYPSSNCNNSLYPVLPASLLYSQLYSAANQSHFQSLHHTSATQGHHELQTVMDQLSTNQRHGSDMLLNSNTSCAAAANRQDDSAHVRSLTANNGAQRGPAQTGGDAVVWRPY